MKKLLSLTFYVTPKHWEFGFGFYVGHQFLRFFPTRKVHMPWAISIMFGPWSLELSGRIKAEELVTGDSR